MAHAVEEVVTDDLESQKTRNGGHNPTPAPPLTSKTRSVRSHGHSIEQHRQVPVLESRLCRAVIDWIALRSVSLSVMYFLPIDLWSKYSSSHADICAFEISLCCSLGALED